MTVISNVLAAENRVVCVKCIYCLSLLSLCDGVSWPLQMRVDIWSDNNIFNDRLINGFIFWKPDFHFWGCCWTNTAAWMDCSPLSAPHSPTVHGLGLINPDSWLGAPCSCCNLDLIRSHLWLHFACTHKSIHHIKEEIWKGFVLSYFPFSSSCLMVPYHKSRISLSSPQMAMALFFSVQTTSSLESNKFPWETAAEFEPHPQNFPHYISPIGDGGSSMMLRGLNGTSNISQEARQLK